METDIASRFVFDTNTLVSAFLFPLSIPGKALELVLSNHRLLMSIELAAELAEVMRREKFDRYLPLQRREELVVSTIRDSEFVAVSSVITSCRDVNDNKIIELAIDGQATAIITGDADLLALHPFRGIAIVTSSDFMSRFPAGKR
jgi:putative PIN family toxin of toxin-antitoxin system